jgi:ribosomal-protein-alanine N-acetyltransferase
MIRSVQLEDLDDIMKIERQSFPVAWEYSVFLNICLQGGQISSGESGSLLMDVIEDNGKIVGYTVWEVDTHKAKGHILNLAIHVNERRKGKGRMLLCHAVEHMKISRIHTCHLEVRESNVAARLLYESTGFIASARIPGYYWDEDAVIYTRIL